MRHKKILWLNFFDLAITRGGIPFLLAGILFLLTFTTFCGLSIYAITPSSPTHVFILELSTCSNLTLTRCSFASPRPTNRRRHRAALTCHRPIPAQRFLRRLQPSGTSEHDLRGGAVQVECSLTHSLKAPWFQVISSQGDILVSKFTFQIQLASLLRGLPRGDGP
jgi:hypothetical protein